MVELELLDLLDIAAYLGKTLSEVVPLDRNQ